MRHWDQRVVFWFASVASTNVLKLVASNFIHVLQHQRRTNHSREEEERLLIQRCHRLTHTDIHLSFSLHSSSELSCVMKDVGWQTHTHNHAAMFESEKLSFDADVNRSVPQRPGDNLLSTKRYFTCWTSDCDPTLVRRAAGRPR